MKVLLEGLLPRLFPGLLFLCVSHEGKQDLERSIPRKLRAWREPGVRFCVVRDNDGADCTRVKDALVTLCREGGRDDCLVRIACQELEAWYFGAPDAIAAAFGRDDIRGIGAIARYRDPDAIVQPSRALADLVPEFQKVSGARRMASHLDRNNSSSSYMTFITGIDRLAAEVMRPEGED
ncbi:MAG: DUF4276 family protein [Candidatus Krumholzibacteria bacterium]|nr:DUF4276 family protein [Candidatus Krumholzibacteria bacterium]